MRPLKLAMTAFGPYKDQEVIDFTVLEDRRLFVISGNTGAGKTTIFDAICFALFGTASGEDRYDSRMLRSHFADEDTHTSVELEFAVGRRSFRVLRQMGHRKGSNKTETGAKVELYERVDGIDVPAVTRYTIPEVNAKLEQILGLTSEQFSQIVMLPQGEFRKLLTSETENKEEILRRIFRTELYQKVEGRFQQQVKELRATLQDKQTELDVYMKQLASSVPLREGSALAVTMQQEHRNVVQVVEGLEQELAYCGEQLEQTQLVRQTLQHELNAKQAKLQEAKTINERRQALESKRLEKAQLDQGLPEHEEKEQRLRRAEKASRLIPYEEQWRSAVAIEEKKRKEVEQKASDAESAAREWEGAQHRYTVEAGREEERKQADRDLQRLLELVPSVETLHANLREVAGLQAQEKQDAGTLAAQEKELSELRGTRVGLTDRERLLEQETAVLAERKDQLAMLREQAKVMKEAVEQERLVGAYRQQEVEREKAFQKMQAEHDQLEKLWLEGQSGFLAAHLHDGLPCPVCGSAEHPRKAEVNEALPNKEQLQETKQLLRHVEMQFNEVRSQLAATRSGLSDKHKDLAEYGYSEVGLQQQYNGLVLRGKELKEETDRLELKVGELQQLKEQKHKIEAQLDKLTQEKEILNLRHKEVLVRLHAKQSALEKELERIPAELRTPEQLQQRLQQQKALSERLLQAWKQVQEQSQRAQAKLAEENATLDQMGRQLKEAGVALEQADTRFREELEKAGFGSVEDYQAVKLTEQQQATLQDELEAFKKAVASAIEIIGQLERELAGKGLTDLVQMNEEIGRTSAELERITMAYQEWRSQLQELERLKASVVAVSEQMKVQEEQWQQVKDIYDVLRGDNPQKLSFERYVLIEFLEQILHAANERLRALSGGQFVLQRSDRLEKHNRQSGLGLDVYDAYTGMNRDVKSMSGGEKFNASLCLALGMTDVIQAHQGGVSIEMMFIDEGFGSLDEEALNKAIETLIDLQQSGRMIGVISHVQELKAAFPAVLEVRKTKEGHSTTSILLK